MYSAEYDQRGQQLPYPQPDNSQQRPFPEPAQRYHTNNYNRPEQLSRSEYVRNQYTSSDYESIQLASSANARLIHPSRHESESQDGRHGQYGGSRRLESPGQYGRPSQHERSGQYENPDQYGRPSQHERPGQHESPGQYENPGQYGRPSQHERPGQHESPGQYEHPGQYGRPSQHERPGQHESPGQYENPGQYGRPNQHERPGQYESLGQHGRPSQHESPGQYESLDQYGRSGQHEIPGQLGSPAVDHADSPMTSQRKEDLLQKEIIRDILADKRERKTEGAWALITYMEGSYPLEKIYVRSESFTIDNSCYPLDQSSIGLRSLPKCRARILLGGHFKIILSQDNDGNILLTNNSYVPVIITDILHPEESCISQEIIELRGIITPGSEDIKVFDIDEFYCQIGLQMFDRRENKKRLRLLSKTNLFFGEAKDNLESPCWLTITSLTALDMISNERVAESMWERIATILARSDGNSLNMPKPRVFSLKDKDVSKLPNKAEPPKRKLRIELMKKGYKVKDFMKYSWDTIYYKDTAPAINIETLMEEFDEPEADYDNGYDNEEVEETDNTTTDNNNAAAAEQNTIHRNIERIHSIYEKQKKTPMVKEWAKVRYILKEQAEKKVVERD